MLAGNIFLGNNIDVSQSQRVVTQARPNLTPVDEQIKALWNAGQVRVYGDRPEHHGQGFSLNRMILAHGTELDPTNKELYFELDARQMSPLPREVQDCPFA